ncbi:hypothetical protein [Aquibacillus kalidii]|uniref:hypothetical protein n=1 Tax=Aquibacillus kalidii TaxID=2762597 RepID=UPI00164930CE|nr:hypothetical protein [Aquibacillus kalidii]
MDDLLGLLPFIIAAIGWFLAKAGKDEKNTSPLPKQQPVSGRSPSSKPIRTEEEQVLREETAPKTEMQTYFEEKQEQLDRVNMEKKGEVKDISHSKGNIYGTIGDKPKKSFGKLKRKEPRLSVARNITKRRVAESVVMAEVLGPPRAVKPYQNVAQNRMNK